VISILEVEIEPLDRMLLILGMLSSNKKKMRIQQEVVGPQWTSSEMQLLNKL